MVQWMPSRRDALSFLGVVAISGVAKAASSVDLALVLAIDCSFSVNEQAYKLQMKGYGEAFLDPKMMEIIAHGPKKRIAVAAFHWSDPEGQQIILPWRVVENVGDTTSIGNLLSAAPRELSALATATGSALLFAQNLLKSAPSATRQVVDVSTDGVCNIGAAAPTARDILTADKITINGLAILDEDPNIASYMERDVIGGENAFVITADDFDAFGLAIKEKLFREIANSVTT